MNEQHPEVDLPERPQLLPGLEVLQRGANEVQIGLDPRHAVVVSDLPQPVIDVLRDLDGSSSARSLLDLPDAEHATRLRALLAGLAERGLLEDAGLDPKGRQGVREPDLWPLRSGRRRQETVETRAGAAMVIHGGGRLAVAVARLLAGAGIGHLDIRSKGVVTEDDLGSGYLDGDVGLPCKQAIVQAVHRANPAVRTTRLTRARPPELVLLTDAVVPAPEVVRDLVADRLPHLPIRVREGTGIVGPLVFPGRSSCLHCADLHRTARDSCWPRVASQLAGRTQRAELGTVQATAALATAQVLRGLHHTTEPPPLWNATLEVDAYVGAVRHRSWLPHPQCPCGARPPRIVRPAP